jgi:hypothetical protein
MHNIKISGGMVLGSLPGADSVIFTEHLNARKNFKILYADDIVIYLKVQNVTIY